MTINEQPLLILDRDGRRFALASAKPTKNAKARRKKSAKKSASADRERKKCEFALFSPSHTGNPVPEPKAARQGEKQGSGVRGTLQ